jgi:hypothetical protein
MKCFWCWRRATKKFFLYRFEKGIWVPGCGCIRNIFSLEEMELIIEKIEDL